MHEIDTDADLTWDSRTLTEFLVDHQNHTGYQQVVRETHHDADTGLVTKTVDYSFGHDEISQTTQDYDGSGNPSGAAIAVVFGHDGHGNVRVLTDLAAAVVQLFVFDSYGQMLALMNGAGVLQSGGNGTFANVSLASTNLLYSGEQFDTRINQQYLRARYYNATTGTFNRLDPFFGRLSDPQSFHKHLYTHGNPVNGVDPTGEFALGLAIAVVIGVVGAFFAAPNIANAPAPGDELVPADNGGGMIGAMVTEIFVAIPSHYVFKYAIGPVASAVYGRLFREAAEATAEGAGTAGGRVIVRRVRQELTEPVGGRLKGDVLAQPGAVDDIMVIGRQADARGFIGQPSHRVLDVPDEMWTIHVNDGWMMRGIMEGRPFKLASEVTAGTLRRVRENVAEGTVTREMTVYFRELKMLKDAGYVQVREAGEVFMKPPAGWQPPPTIGVPPLNGTYGALAPSTVPRSLQ